MSYYPNYSKQASYAIPHKPFDDVIKKDPFNDWQAFNVPSLSSFKSQSPGSVSFGQRYKQDNPFGQPQPGQLFGGVILPPVVTVPSPISIEADIAASANLDAELQGPTVTKKPELPEELKPEPKTGSGFNQSTNPTWAIPPNVNLGHTVSPPAMLFF